MNKIVEHLIYLDIPTAAALQKLSGLGHDLTLFVIDTEDRLCGSLTDGDIRRGLLNGLTLSDTVNRFMNKNFKSIEDQKYTLAQIKEYRTSGIMLLPLVDDCRRIIKLINLNFQETILPVTAVIMAGGEGQRLRPLTENTPKSLLRVGTKPIIEHVIDRLAMYGVSNINISINYLGAQLIEYFKGGEDKNVNISYLREKEKLGTAGALNMVRDLQHDTVLLMNADLLTNLNFEDFYTQFKESEADLMVACIPYSVKVPYAVFELEGKNVLSLQEKPTFTYYSNAGIYLLKKEHLSLIPTDRSYDATDLIEDLIKEQKKVLYHPILGFWLDIGNHDDYNKANRYLEQNSFNL